MKEYETFAEMFDDHFKRNKHHQEEIRKGERVKLEAQLSPAALRALFELKLQVRQYRG